MNAKTKDARHEHRSITLLEAAGYGCARAATSLGTWDGISAVVVLVQVKIRIWPGLTARDPLQDCVCPTHCRKLVHRWWDRHDLA